MADSKRLFTPESTQELFNGWLLHAHKARDRHDLSARWFELGHYVFGVPALVLTTIVGTSVSSHLNANGSPPYWVAVISVIAAVVTALQTFLDLAKRAERHRAITAKYKAVIRLIEQYRTELAIDGALPAETITSLRGQFDALEADAPGFFPMVFGKVERRYRDATHVEEALGLSEA